MKLTSKSDSRLWRDPFDVSTRPFLEQGTPAVEAAQAGMLAFGIVTVFDGLEDSYVRLALGTERTPFDPFTFQRVEKTIGNCVIEATPMG